MILTLEITGPREGTPSGENRKVFRAAGGTIGRLPDNDWVLPDPHVSGRHARIRYTNGVFHIEDTKSANGISINSQENRLTRGQPYALKSGDRIFIEPYEIRASIGTDPAQAIDGAFVIPDPFEHVASPPRVPPPAAIIPSDPLGSSSSEVDPLRVLGFDAPAPQKERAPRVDDLARGSLLSEHYQPPPVPTPAPPRSAGPIPADYDPLGSDSHPDAPSANVETSWADSDGRPSEVVTRLDQIAPKGIPPTPSGDVDRTVLRLPTAPPADATVIAHPRRTPPPVPRQADATSDANASDSHDYDDQSSAGDPAHRRVPVVKPGLPRLGWLRRAVASARSILRPSSRAVMPIDASFAAFAPTHIVQSRDFVLDIWAYAHAFERDVFTLAGREGQASLRGFRSGVSVDVGTTVVIWISVPGFQPAIAAESIVWNGRMANATFVLRTEDGTVSGSYLGTAKIMCGAVPVGRLHFELVVGSGRETRHNVVLDQSTIRSAFASYASEDRLAVLQWARGAEVAGVDVFLDVLKLRAGATWETELSQHVPTKDLFCLFWSQPASRSPWVDREWRCALKERGIDYIHPVPLADPRVVTPPIELRGKHFGGVTFLAQLYEQQISHRSSDPFSAT